MWRLRSPRGLQQHTFYQSGPGEAKHIAAPAVTPTHPGINCIFISARYQSVGPGIRCKMFYIYHVFLASSVLSGSLGLSIYHRSLSTCFLLLLIMRSVDTEISPAPGPGTARGISENHSPSVTREQSGAGAGPDNCGKSESQYKVSRFGTLEHKLCKSLNKQRFYYCFISGLEVLQSRATSFTRL